MVLGVVPVQPLRLGPWQFRVPQERAEHQRVLQSLGTMHGDDVDQVLVALQTQFLDLVLGATAARGRCDTCRQPLERSGRTEPGMDVENPCPVAFTQTPDGIEVGQDKR